MPDMAHAVQESSTQRSALGLEWASTPEGVVDRLRNIDGDLRKAYSANTLKASREDWKVWMDFCDRSKSVALPAEKDPLRDFLMEGIALGKKKATLARYLATLSRVHSLAGLPWPLATHDGKVMWRGIWVEHLKERQRQAKALGIDAIERIQLKLKGEHPRDARDDALISVAYEAMLRESELVALKVDQVEVQDDGSGRLLLERSKTDQAGKGAVQFLSPETVEKIARWRRLAGVEEGFLFRSVRFGKQPRMDKPLQVREVDRILKRRATAAGVNAERLSGHSTRIGATQDLLTADFSGIEIMQQGRWKSEKMVLRYAEKLEAGRGAMARFTRSRKIEKAVTEESAPSEENKARKTSAKKRGATT